MFCVMDFKKELVALDFLNFELLVHRWPLVTSISVKSLRFRQDRFSGWARSKQTPLWLTVTRAFQRIKELSFGVCHEKAKWVLGFHKRRLFGRLARAMAITRSSKLPKWILTHNYIMTKIFKWPWLWAIDDPWNLIYSNQTALVPSLSPQLNKFSKMRSKTS